MSDDDKDKTENGDDGHRGNGSVGGHWDDSKIAVFPDEKTRKAREDARKQALADEAAREKAQEKMAAKLAAQAVWRGDGAELSKSEPILNLPRGTKLLLTVIVMVHLGTLLLDTRELNEFLIATAFMPARYSGALPLGWQGVTSIVTHMFVHGGWMHLAINVLMLMAFGSGLERSIGAKRMLILFFASGIIGALFHLLLFFGSMNPMIGASGGISGLFGAALLMLQGQGRLGPGDGKKFIGTIALIMLVLIGLGMLGAPGSGQPIAWTTHVGGFVAGLVLYKKVLKIRD